MVRGATNSWWVHGAPVISSRGSAVVEDPVDLHRDPPGVCAVHPSQLVPGGLMPCVRVDAVRGERVGVPRTPPVAVHDRGDGAH
jgi:hypothetical protein